MATPVVAEALAPFERSERMAAGSAVFQEGEEAEGVWTIRSGEIDLVFESSKGVARALRVAETGQILGLSAVISRSSHDCSATVRHDAELGFIARDRFLSLLEQQPTLWLTVLQTLSSDINSCWDCMRNLTRG